MVKKIKDRLAAFASIFKDSNDVSEINVIGFIALTVMILIAITSVVARLVGNPIVVNHDIYNSFTLIVCAAFFSDAVKKQAISRIKNHQKDLSPKDEEIK